MPVIFRLLTEADVKSVLSMDDLIDAMAGALQRFSSGAVAQPVRTVIPIGGDHAFFGLMPAFAGGDHKTGVSAGSPREALGAKLVTVFGGNTAKGLDTHLASIVLLDPETGALQALLDGRYITEARTAAVSAVSSRLLAKKTAKSLAIVGAGVQARSHFESLTRVHGLKQVTVCSRSEEHRTAFLAWAKHEIEAGHIPSAPSISSCGHPGEAVVGADIVVLVTSSPTPVIESGWVKPGAHVICVGACRPNQREMDPALTARARVFVDSRTAALVESGDILLAIQEGRITADHIVAELGELVAGAAGRRNDTEVTIFKSLGMAVEDVTAADLAYRRAVEKGIGRTLEL